MGPEGLSRAQCARTPKRELKARSVKPDLPEDNGLRSIVPTAIKLALLDGTSIWRA